MTNVGVVGYGTIGRRVAWAVSMQPDLSLVGAVKRTPDYLARRGIEKDINFYVPGTDDAAAWKERGLKFHGTLEDLLDEVDIAVDATPAGMGIENKPAYEGAGVRAIFEGGETAGVAEASFVAQANFEDARNKRFIRVVSCNTTALARLLSLLDKEFGAKKSFIWLVRRSVDPNEDEKGLVDTLVPSMDIPSHHAEDVKTILPDLDVFTVALKAPTTHFHLHLAMVQLERKTSREEVIDCLLEGRRMLFVSAKDGVSSTGKLFDLGRELDRPRGDVYENVIWLDSIHLKEDWLLLMQAAHQEAIVIPENVDAIRASLSALSPEESMNLTDEMLSIRRRLV